MKEWDPTPGRVPCGVCGVPAEELGRCKEHTLAKVAYVGRCAATDCTEGGGGPGYVYVDVERLEAIDAIPYYCSLTCGVILGALSSPQNYHTRKEYTTLCLKHAYYTTNTIFRCNRRRITGSPRCAAHQQWLQKASEGKDAFITQQELDALRMRAIQKGWLGYREFCPVCGKSPLGCRCSIRI